MLNYNFHCVKPPKHTNKCLLTIAFYRRARGLTQSELAEAVQISRTHMSNIEAPNSHTSLSLNKLMDIAESLEIPLKTLFDFKR